MACVKPRRGRWVLDYRDAFGRRRTPSWPKTAEGKRAADDALGEVLRRRRGGELAAVVDPRITVEQYNARWQRNCKARQLKAQTLAHYEYVSRIHIIPELGKLPLVKLSRPIILEYLAKKLEDGYPRTTTSNIYKILRAMLSAAVDDQVIAANPAFRAGTKLKLTTRNPSKVKAMTAEQLRLFLETARDVVPGHYLQLLVYAYTGLRLGEGMGLQLDDPDFGLRQIRIERQVTPFGFEEKVRHVEDGEDLKTIESRRIVDYTDVLEKPFHELRARAKEYSLRNGGTPAPWLLYPEIGMPPETRVVKRCRTALQRAVHQVCDVAKLPNWFTLHCLRHTFASQLLLQGKPAQYVQRQLGHANIQTTVDLYGSWMQIADVAAVDTFAARTFPRELVADANASQMHPAVATVPRLGPTPIAGRRAAAKVKASG